MKWVLILIYVGGFGTPIHMETATFMHEQDCRSASVDFMKKHPDITAQCDFREPGKDRQEWKP